MPSSTARKAISSASAVPIGIRNSASYNISGIVTPMNRSSAKNSRDAGTAVNVAIATTTTAIAAAPTRTPLAAVFFPNPRASALTPARRATTTRSAAARRVNGTEAASGTIKLAARFQIRRIPITASPYPASRRGNRRSLDPVDRGLRADCEAVISPRCRVSAVGPTARFHLQLVLQDAGRSGLPSLMRPLWLHATLRGWLLRTTIA